jgi:hypothetical protein
MAWLGQVDWDARHTPPLTLIKLVRRSEFIVQIHASIVFVYKFIIKPQTPTEGFLWFPRDEPRRESRRFLPFLRYEPNEIRIQIKAFSPPVLRKTEWFSDLEDEPSTVPPNDFVAPLPRARWCEAKVHRR